MLSIKEEVVPVTVTYTLCVILMFSHQYVQLWKICLTLRVSLQNVQ